MKFIFLGLLLISLSSIGQISSKSRVHKPSNYTIPFDLNLYQKSLSQKNYVPVINEAGLEVKRIYSRLSHYPKNLQDGWYNVYAITEIDRKPVNCYLGKAEVIHALNGDKMTPFIKRLIIDETNIIFEASGEIEKCKSHVYWNSGNNKLDVYFLEAAINANAIYKENNVRTTVIENGDKYYSGYEIVSFAKKIKFKPQYYTFADWEKAVITVFSTNANASAAAKQINIDAMYYSENNYDEAFNLYNKLYGIVEEFEFMEYRRLFAILMITDHINRK